MLYLSKEEEDGDDINHLGMKGAAGGGREWILWLFEINK